MCAVSNGNSSEDDKIYISIIKSYLPFPDTFMSQDMLWNWY